jgi:hypothetical protein
MREEHPGREFVLARLHFLKNDLYQVEVVSRFADEAAARAWAGLDQHAASVLGAWQQWTELHALERRGRQFIDLAGAPVLTTRDRDDHTPRP